MKTPKTYPTTHSPRDIWITKIVFHAFACAFALGVFGTSGYADTNFNGLYSSAYFVPPAFFSFIWNIVNSYVIIRRPSRFGVNVIAALIFELVLFVGYATGAMTFGVLANVDGNYSDMSETWMSVYDMRSGLIAVASFGCTAHFALFVIACYEVDVKYRLQPAAAAASRPVVDIEAHPENLCHNCKQMISAPPYSSPESTVVDGKH